VARDVQRTNEEARFYLTAGSHVLRAELIGEQFRKPVPRPPAGRPVYSRSAEMMIYPEKFDLLGPFPAAGPRPVRERILICDPATGLVCIQRILAPLTRMAYRRPVTKSLELNNIYIFTGVGRCRSSIRRGRHGAAERALGFEHQ
jgi:hypothetical protein